MATLRNTLGDLLGESETSVGCDCEAAFEGETLVVDGDDCDGGGRLVDSPACRETVVSTLADRDAEAIRVTADGIERIYENGAVALLVAAGRFVDCVAAVDERLAARARRDPLGAAREATGRADRAADVAAETGLAATATAAEGYESVLAPVVGLSVSRWRVETDLPPDARLADVTALETDATVRHYESAGGRGLYALEPAELALDSDETRLLARAYDRLATGDVGGGERAPRRALRQVAPDGTRIGPLVPVLRKHTRGHGLLKDLFADDRVSDVFVTAPAPSNPVRVRVGDRTLATNVRLTEAGLRALSSRFRRESGRGFSRADPTLDAATEVAGRRIRVAAVRAPASDGTAFAFRAHDRTVRTLPSLVADGTLTADAAGLLSVAVERGRSLLVAGARGAGKTTLLGALLWAVPPAVRTLCIEDTPELPVDPLQESGRDVQALRTTDADGQLSPVDALRTALRLGDGALVLGEVRGEEARVLYEAMRIGAHSEAVLGTIHGDGAGQVYERVVSDLGVDASAFGATDAVVTMERTADGTRRLSAIEEVVTATGEERPAFEPLHDRTGGSLAPTGRIDRGNSRLVAGLAGPDESYADVLDALDERAGWLADLAASGRTGGQAVTAAQERRI